ncbi:unnamed protein product [uncultured virus]|nr:unnamed protein product [uncultured virus]
MLSSLMENAVWAIARTELCSVGEEFAPEKFSLSQEQKAIWKKN